jgi:hypothetical protein
VSEIALEKRHKEAQEEARQAEEREARIGRRLRKWTYATIFLGIALSIAIASSVPFLYGHSLHDQWESVGKRLVELSMGLFLVFVWTAGMTFTMWKYSRDMQRSNKKYAPRVGKHKTEISK